MARLSWFAGLLAASSLVFADGMYTKSSPVLQVNAKNYDSLIAQSNHTSILEFYAPWCGHCQNLKPAYEKAAKNLAGLAKVAAINCDEEPNKPLCGRMGVQGFPTLKIIKPGSQPGKPVIEDYQGPRSAKAIVDTIVEKISNHVTRLQEDGVGAWLEENAQKPKVLVFTEKGIVSALIRSLAIDFLGSIDFAQIRTKDTKVAEKYGVTRLPSLVLVQQEGHEPVVYAEEMKKGALLDFLSQAAFPNPDPAPKKAKAPTSSKKSKSTSSKATESSKKPPVEVEDFQEIVLDDNAPLESSIPIVDTDKPTPILQAATPIPILSTPFELKSLCLAPRSGTCILVLLPGGSATEAARPEPAADALTALAEVAHKHTQRKARIFPFYAISADDEAGKIIRSELGLRPSFELEIISINMRRGWWSLYRSDTFNGNEIENFVDGIKLGESTKLPLPEGVFADDTPPEPQPAAEPAASISATPSAAEPLPEAEPTATTQHDEL